MALHHKLCHVLGGSWNLPHAETHTVILPHVLAYNAAAVPAAMGRIERAMNTPNAVSANCRERTARRRELRQYSWKASSTRERPLPCFAPTEMLGWPG